MPSSLQTLLAAIPTAEEGHIITQEYHNSLRAALLDLAGQVGVSLAKSTVVTFAPSFFPSDPSANWAHDVGKAYLNLETVNMTEARAKAKAELIAAVAAAAISTARMQDVNPLVNKISERVGLLPSLTRLLEAGKTAIEKANAAQAALQSVADALEAADVETKLRDAVQITEEALARTSDVAQDLAPSPLWPPSFPTLLVVQARGKAFEARAEAGTAVEKAKAAETIIKEAVKAQGSGKPSSCAGWLAFQFPQGARLQNVRVIGQMKGLLQQFQINLVRQKIEDSAEITLLSLDLKSAAATFEEKANIPSQASGLKEDDVTIDNTLYKYLITAQASGIAGALAQINTIQITYSM